MHFNADESVKNRGVDRIRYSTTFIANLKGRVSHYGMAKSQTILGYTLHVSTKVGTQNKGKCIGVQPTSITRRNVVLSGKNIQTGRKVMQDNETLSQAPHSLMRCVDKNIGLGPNKYKK